MVAMLTSHGLYSFVDRSFVVPTLTLTDDGKEVPNPAYATWCAKDQRILSLLLSTLTKESMFEVIGFKSSCDVWLALEAAFSHSSTSHAHQSCDELHLLKKGSSSVQVIVKDSRCYAINLPPLSGR